MMILKHQSVVITLWFSSQITEYKSDVSIKSFKKSSGYQKGDNLYAENI